MKYQVLLRPGKKHMKIKQPLIKLKLSNSYFTNDQSEILREQMHFYKTLYSSDKNRSPDLNDSALSVFSENIISLENHVKLSECLKALKTFKNEKSPGTDGLQAEFYKHFWKEQYVDMMHSSNFAFDSRSLSISQRRGIIMLTTMYSKTE